MPRKKKNFIDKKDPNTYTFSLVHRSQRDPLIADPDAPQLVLAPTVSANDNNPQTRTKKAPVSVVGALKVEDETAVEKFKAKAELADAGVLFSDDYDYSQHLRVRRDPAEGGDVYMADQKQLKKLGGGVNDVSDLLLPADLLGSSSTIENDVGMLNLAAPHSGLRLDWDPEVVAALDDDYDYDNPENTLADNFFDLVNADVLPENLVYDDADDSGGEGDSSGWETDDTDTFEGVTRGGDIDSERAFDHLATMLRDDKDETNTVKSRFTEYSMTSSILPRSEILQFQDDRFEKLYEQYDDEQLGALDEEGDVIGGMKDLKDIENVLDEFLEKSNASQMKTIDVTRDQENTKELSAAIKSLVDEQYDGKLKQNDLNTLEYKDGEIDKTWDCESILSTRSTLYNHPRRIVETSKKIRVHKRTGMPIMETATKSPAASADHPQAASKSDESGSDDGEKETVDNLGEKRSKVETPEEKRLRKKAIKDAKRDRRLTKKATKTAFKDEEVKQKQERHNNPEAGRRVTRLD